MADNNSNSNSNSNNNSPTKNSPTKNNILMLFVRAHGMKSSCNKTGNIFGAADSFFEVSNEHKEVVARSSVQFNDLTPKWPPIKLDLETLCQNDDSKMVYLSFYDHQPNQAHEWMKTILTTVQGMKQAAQDCREQQQQQQQPLPPLQIGGRIRVDIYDAIIVTGTPTVGTLTKSAVRSKRTSEATMSETLSSLSDEEVTIDENIGRILSFRSDMSDTIDDAAARADVELEQLTIETLDFGTLGVNIDDVELEISEDSLCQDLPTVQEIASLFQQTLVGEFIPHEEQEALADNAISNQPPSTYMIYER